MRALLVLTLPLYAACVERPKMDGDAEGRQLSVSTGVDSPHSTGAATLAATRPERAPAATVVFLGTSLTSGYGLSAERAYPAVVSRLAADDDLPIQAINAGVSGETSAGALRRVEWVLRNQPADVYVIETGANDGLRALDIDATRGNITALIRRIQRERPTSRVLLVQMEAPPNLGADYTSRFREIYPSVARATGVVLVPFLLEGVAAIPTLNQADGIHPNVAGAERVGANIWAHLRPVLERR